MKFKNNKCIEINKNDYDYIKSLWENNCARNVFQILQEKYELNYSSAFNLGYAVYKNYKYMEIVE